MSEPKDSYYIVESAAYIRPQQYVMSTAPGHYRITTNIEQATHFQTLSDAKAAADLPGLWSINRTWIPTLVLEIEPLAPPPADAVQLVDGQTLLNFDEATIDPAGEFPAQTQEGLAASVTLSGPAPEPVLQTA